MSEKENEVLLEGWSVVESGSPYTAPELRRKVLRGYAFGHPRLSDTTKRILTSVITSTGKLREGDLVRTKNTLYRLGNMDPKFRTWWENQN